MLTRAFKSGNSLAIRVPKCECALAFLISRNAVDRLIAAHALSTGLALVTHNKADFKDYPGLRVENWALGT